MRLSSCLRYPSILVLLAALPLSAATYTVTNTNDSGAGSLRHAILNANQPPGGHRIEFAIGSGPQTIHPVTNLPSVSSGTVIDGRTQPGYSGKPIIEIDGSLVAGNWSNVTGLNIGSADVYGLVINNFVGAAIRITSGSVRNCYIGTDVSGTAKKGNQVGIVTYSSVTIGGAGANDGNLISGNYVGVEVHGAVSIQGNAFGTNATRTAVLDSSAQHISIENITSGSSTIGDVAPNVFAGGQLGIEIFYSNNVRIEGNYFGTTPDGASMPIRTAVKIYQSSENVVIANVIHNNDIAVEVSGNSLRNRIRDNSIYGNRFGIDLQPSGEYPYGKTTPNDPGDTDTGPNNLMNFPILGRITFENGKTTIPGTVSTIPNRAHRIEIYQSPTCNQSGHGEGKTFVDALDATSDGSGTITFTRTLPPIAPGTSITATVTSNLEGTSEFSPCAIVEGPGVFSFQTTSAGGTEGSATTVTVQRKNGAVDAASVSYAVTGGSATADDFSGGSGTLNFADGETTKTITIQTTQDSVFEGDESIVLSLSGATNGTSIGSPATLQVIIHDDDPPPTVTLQGLSTNEGNSGTKVVEVSVTLSAPIAAPYSVAYTVSSWNATPGVDYIATSGTVTFAAGETAQTIPITIVGDLNWESNEHVTVALAAKPWVSANVVIVNDDPVPTVEAEILRIPEGNATSTATVTLRASEPVTGWVEVSLRGGSAQPSTDFVPFSDQLYFSNESTKSFAITILGDLEPEQDESFTVEVLSLSYGIRGSSNGGVTLVNDDAGLGPVEQWIPAGSSGEFTLRLGQPATENVTVAIASDAPSAVSVPASLVIPAGQISANFAASALAPGETANITVSFPPSLGGLTRSVRVRTYAKATLRFSPGRLTVLDGETATVAVSLDPPVSTTTTLGVRSSDAVEVPRSLTIPAGGSGTLLVTARRIGSFVIDAQLPPIHGNEIQSLYGEVVEEPKTPAILSLTPSHGPTSGGTEVTITGVHLRRECTIAFGGVAAASATFIDATSMSAVTPPHAGGTVDVSLACGSDSFVLANGFGYVSEAPRVASVRPSSGTTAGGTHVQVGGTHFDGSCWLFFGRFAAAEVVVRDPQTITGVTPPRAAGQSDITLRCSGGTSTLPAAFTYRGEDDPAPLITDIVPTAAAPGELVTIRGLNFRTTDTATMDATPATIVDPSPESHVVRVPELPAGLTSVFVEDVFGRMTTSGPLFSVLEARPPRITSVSPASVAAGAELELTGEGFRPGYTFEIGGGAATIVTVEYTRAIVRVSLHAAAGMHPVMVHNSAGALAAIGPGVEIAGAGLVITSADPRCALTDGGVYTTLRGRGFTSHAIVSFDGIPSADVRTIDDATLRVLVPPGAAGVARITVSNGPGTTATLTNGFVFASPFDPRGCGGRTRTVRH